MLIFSVVNNFSITQLEHADLDDSNRVARFINDRFFSDENENHFVMGMKLITNLGWDMTMFPTLQKWKFSLDDDPPYNLQKWIVNAVFNKMTFLKEKVEGFSLLATNHEKREYLKHFAANHLMQKFLSKKDLNSAHALYHQIKEDLPDVSDHFLADLVEYYEENDLIIASLGKLGEISQMVADRYSYLEGDHSVLDKYVGYHNFNFVSDLVELLLKHGKLDKALELHAKHSYRDDFIHINEYRLMEALKNDEQNLAIDCYDQISRVALPEDQKLLSNLKGDLAKYAITNEDFIDKVRRSPTHIPNFDRSMDITRAIHYLERGNLDYLTDARLHAINWL